MESARTSGVFWSTSNTRDNRRFPGAAEKTLHGQSLESVSAEGNRAMLNVEEERDDSLLWPGVRPPEIDPSLGLEEAVFVVSRFLKKTFKTGVKGCSRDPGVMIVYDCTCLYRYFTL